MFRRRVEAQEIRGQFSARTGRGTGLALGVANVGDGGKAPLAPHTDPGAAGGQVASGEHSRRVIPELRRGAWPRVELVAVGYEQQGCVGAHAPGKGDQAHGFDPDFAAAFVRAPGLDNNGAVVGMADSRAALPARGRRLLPA